MISQNFLPEEDDLEKYIGCSKDEIVKIFGESEVCYGEELIYTLRSNFFGLYKQRLYLFFYKGKLRDFYIGI
ncbi:hypothetical protein MQX03_15365 [Chryseobacterium aahli]|uniref:hypothetical protein n=1 Tax=Chryseobacterium aahli TaxID=1278643 RepID=UPI001F613C3D|nr:hypothetical protein [Chryseobacterium aahli]MCI3938577.1 hypothetical protein [Chryseobacterium aahli]